MLDVLVPAWPAPPSVRALVTTRAGGLSEAPWNSLNLGDHVGDNPLTVAANRAMLRSMLPAEPVWMRQTHGTRCIDAGFSQDLPEADAAFSRQRGVVCAVLTADCLPVFLCDEAGSVVGVAHAGWRGLAAGVIEATVAAMRSAQTPAGHLIAWLGPAIGPRVFEVGPEVRDIFIAHDSAATEAFCPGDRGKWLCDIQELARQRLAALGIRRLTSADSCTVSEPERFFSYRRDGVTGRMASLIWLD